MTDVHCDDLIDDPTQPECLRRFLRYKRLPAVCQAPGGKVEDVKRFVRPDLVPHIWTDPEPALFATTREDHTARFYLGYWNGSEPAMREVEIPAGTRVRVTMASRFGDVGITPDLEANYGYTARVPVSMLDQFSGCNPVP